MKRAFAMACFAAATMFMSAGSAQAQCGGGFGGGFGGGGFGVSSFGGGYRSAYGGYSGGRIYRSGGYSRYTPRSSFSVGYSRFPGYSYRSYRGSYRSPLGYRGGYSRSYRYGY